MIDSFYFAEKMITPVIKIYGDDYLNLKANEKFIAAVTSKGWAVRGIGNSLYQTYEYYNPRYRIYRS